MKVTLTKVQAGEVEHKISILCDEPDLQEGYGLSAEQCAELRNSIPVGAGEWIVPEWAEEAVRGEMEDHVVVLRDMARDAREDDEVVQAMKISRLATSLEKLFVAEESTMKDSIDKVVDELVEGDGHPREEIVGKLKDVFRYFSRNLGWGDRLTGLVRALYFLLIGEGKERKVNMAFVASHLPALIKYLEDNKQEGYLEVVNSALSYLKDEGALGEGVNEDSKPTRRFRASIYVDVWVPETDDLEADREVAKQAVEGFANEIPNSYVGDVAHYRPHVTSGSPLDREL